MGLWDKIRQTAGNIVGQYGKTFGVDEVGASEFVSGQPRMDFPMIDQKQQQYLQSEADKLRRIQQGNITGGDGGPGPAPTGGGGPAPAGGGPPMEQAPSQPTEQDLMSRLQGLIQPALDILTQEEQRATALGGEIQTAIGAGAEAQRGTIETGLKGAGVTAERGRRESGALAESAISQARRGFSEIQRGLVSRFGGGVSTGLGAISHLGGETMRNIAGIQTGLQESMTRINETYANIEAGAQQSLKEVDAWLVQQKTSAKGELNEILSSIGREKGALQSQKATWVQEALNRYQDTVNAVNQRNTAFKQDIYKMTEDARLQAQNTAAKIAQQAQQIEPFTLSEGQQRFFPGEQPEGMSPETLGGTDVGQAGKYWWLRRGEDEEEEGLY